MKENDFIIIYVLVSGILMGAAMYGTISSQKYKTDVSGKTSIESVYDAKFHGFEWRGHKYFKYGGSANPPVLHDPDCPCWTNRLETLR